MTIGQRIKAKRKELRLSADELGAKLGKDRSTIYRYEKGDIENLPLDILEPIAEALHTTPQFLMGWEEVRIDNDTITEIIARMRSDDNFLSVVKTLHKMGEEMLGDVKNVLSFLDQYGQDAVTAVLDVECRRCTAQTNEPKLIKVRQAARNGGAPCVTMMTQSELDEIENLPDADPDL